MLGCESLPVEIKSASEGMPQDVNQEPKQGVEMFAAPEVFCVVAADPERCLGVRIKNKVPCKQI